MAKVKAAARTKSLLVKERVKQRRLSPDERRAEFVQKAMEFFAEHGFDAGTRELARELGVTQPLLYRYFPSKDDLIAEVYRTVYLQRWRPEWDTLLADRHRPLRERLQTFYEAYTDAIFTREWMRIYLFSGLKGVDINRWYVGLVQDRILARIVKEVRFDAGLGDETPPAATDMERAWVLHGGIFYYGVRKHIYGADVLEDKSRVIANALDVFLRGIAEVMGGPGNTDPGRAPIVRTGRSPTGRAPTGRVPTGRAPTVAARLKV
jgi:AcrR family transcriptional regulator